MRPLLVLLLLGVALSAAVPQRPAFMFGAPFLGMERPRTAQGKRFTVDLTDRDSAEAVSVPADGGVDREGFLQAAVGRRIASARARQNRISSFLY